MFTMRDIDLQDLTIGTIVLLVIGVVYSFYKAAKIRNDIRSIRKWLYLVQFYCLKEEREIIDAMIGKDGPIRKENPKVAIEDNRTVFMLQGEQCSSLLESENNCVRIRIFDEEDSEVDSATVYDTLPEFQIIKDVTRTLVEHHNNVGYNLKRMKLILTNIEIPNNKDVKEVVERISTYVIDTRNSYNEIDKTRVIHDKLSDSDNDFIQQLIYEGKVILAIPGR